MESGVKPFGGSTPVETLGERFPWDQRLLRRLPSVPVYPRVGQCKAQGPITQNQNTTRVKSFCVVEAGYGRLGHG
jgi:hypothetical protein